MRKPKVRSNNGCCCIRFTTPDGVNHSLTQGRMDNPLDVARMERIALEVYEQVLNGSFSGLDKYKRGEDKPTIKAILDGLESHRGKQPHVEALIKVLSPGKGSSFSPELLNNLFNKTDLSPSSKRRYQTQLRVLFPQWAAYFTCKFSTKGSTKNDREPFTDSEVQIIKEIFEKDSLYSQFTYFLLATGCRPSEAMGLRIQDIDPVEKRIRIAESLSRSLTDEKQRVRKSTKTNKVRYFPINAKLHDFLFNNLLNKNAVSLLIFSEDGITPINERNLRYTWRKRLKKAGIRYRPPYTCRHTFISHCLRKGVDVATVAKWVGNSPDIIWKHYAGSIGQEQPPELF